jgi:hypothetical protein
MFEQQVRAELEAEAWRRLRAQLAGGVPALEQVAPAPPAAVPTAAAAQGPSRVRDPHRSGSAILKGLVRFLIAAFGSYLTYIAGMDSQLGTFEVWLATGTAFVIVLAVSAFEPLRGAVHAMAETTRWMLIVGAVIGIAWVVTHMSA